jgi:hypothetical protein
MRGGRPRSAWVLWQSEAVFLTGRGEEARHLALQALDLARTCHERGSEAWALWLMGEIARQCQPVDASRAVMYYGQALAVARELGMRPLQAHCHRGLGRLYATTGQVAQARTALATASVLYGALDMAFWLTQTEAALEHVETGGPVPAANG